MSIFSDIINAAHDYTVEASGPGAMTVSTALSFITTTGTDDALTLATGEVGQLKMLTMKTDGGDGILTPTPVEGFSTITFTAVGNWVILRFNGRAWKVANSYGVTVNA